jgi:antitoxin component YwqK of YwqJK toxin-antitoxin module
MKKLMSLLFVLFFSFAVFAQKDTTVVKYYDNGNVQETLSFKGEKLHGKCYTWSIDGIQTGEASYEDGVKHGIWKIWREDGTLAYEMLYERGEKVGEWKYYGENGELLAIRKF